MGRAWPVLVLLAFTQFCTSWGSLTIIGVQVEMRSGLGVSADAIAAASETRAKPNDNIRSLKSILPLIISVPTLYFSYCFYSNCHWLSF